jgi:WD40 repeat protein
MMRVMFLVSCFVLPFNYFALNLSAQEKETKPLVVQELKGIKGIIRTLTFSGNGKLLAAAPISSSTIYLWELFSGKEKVPLQMPKENNAYQLMFSHDSRTLYSCGDNDPMIRIWDVSTGKQLREFNPWQGTPRAGRKPSDYFLAFSPGANLIAMRGANYFSSIDIYDVAKEKIIQSLDRTVGVTCAFSPDGQTLVTLSHFGDISFWDVKSGKVQSQGKEKIQLGAFIFFSFSPDGKWVAVGGHIGDMLRILEVSTGNERPSLKTKGFFRGASFSLDGSTLASISHDGLRFHDLKAGKELYQLKPSRGNACLSFSPDGSLLGVGGGDGTIYLYKMPSRDKSPTQNRVSDGN